MWLKNIVLHPPYQNSQYDAQDKNYQLKNLKEIIKEVELWNKLHFQNIKQQKNLGPSFGVSKLEIYTNSNKKEKISLSNTPEKRQNSVDALSPAGFSKNETVIQKQIMLIIEDNSFCQSYLQETLNLLNVDYETAINGLDGVKIVERYLQRGKMFDIILMDLIMPTMDGYQASSEIRELENKYNININDRLFICGYTSLLNLEVEKKCLERGMDDVVAKPINIRALERMLSRNDRRKSRQNSANQSSNTNQYQIMQAAISVVSDSRKDNNSIKQVVLNNTLNFDKDINDRQLYKGTYNTTQNQI